MTGDEVAALLRYVASTDGRSLTDLSAASWLDLLADVPSEVARRAVQDHYRHSTDRLMPVHIHNFWRAERARQSEADQAWVAPPRGRATPSHIAACIAQVRATVEANRRARATHDETATKSRTETILP